MPRLLLLYATNTGHTEVVARQIAEQIRQQAPIEVGNVATTPPEAILGRDLVIFGSPTWDQERQGQRMEGQLQDQMEQFLAHIRRFDLRGMPMAVFGLGDSRYTYFCGGAVLLDQFIQEVGALKVGTTLYLDMLHSLNTDLVAEWTTDLLNAWRTSSLAATPARLGT